MPAQTENTENTKDVEWAKVEQIVKREATRRFGRELGRLGAANISSFTLEMIHRATEGKLGAAPKQGTLA